MRRVLIVDDDRATGEVMCEELMRAGYEALVARDGGEALRLVQHPPQPDLILLDMIMPGMDGCATLAEIRADRDLATVPVVAMSGASRQWLPDCGVDGFLQKPFTIDELLGVVESRCQ